MKRFAVFALSFALSIVASAAAPPRPTSVTFTQGNVVRSLAIPPSSAWGKGALVYTESLLNNGVCRFTLGGQFVQFAAPCDTIVRNWVYAVTTCPQTPPPASQNATCPNGAGTFPQTHGWAQSPPPLCTLTALDWLPATPGPNDCQSTPPPPTTSYECNAGSGHDYQVGTGAGQLATLDLVPWETLAAGDTVRIFYKSTAYKGKFAINAHGTAAAWVDVCGVWGPNGEKPIVDANGAVTRPTSDFGRTSAYPDNESRGIAIIVTKGVESGVRQPDYIKIRGLSLKNAYPDSTFRNTAGATKNYQAFGGAIWVDAGHNIEISDNEIADSGNCIFTRSIEGSEAVVSEYVHIARNYVHGCGIIGEDHEHSMYIQSKAPIVEGNRVGPMRAGSGGNAFKDRSVGPVYRNNKVESGTYAFDLVEAEDYLPFAEADPAYRSSFVYGNIVSNDSALGIHYGGDNGNYRGGTVYVWNNTFNMSGRNGEGALWLFRLSTTHETAEVWNNLFYCARGDDNYFCAFRTMQDIGGAPSGGVLNLGVNWMTHGCAPEGVDDPRSVCDGDPYHLPAIPMNGGGNLIVGLSAPFNTTTFAPSAAVRGVAQPPLAAVAAYPITQQIDANGALSPRLTVHDLGAREGTSP